jgi:hypothetical protein
MRAMPKRTKVMLIVFGASVVAGIAALQVWPLARGYFSHPVDAFTDSLPTIDRVEVYHLVGIGGDAETGFPVRPYNAYSRIIGSAELTGADAESLASLWRSQTFGWKYQAMCHDPGFGLRFYRGPSLLFETSVCFSCKNFYFAHRGESIWWGFDSKTPGAAELLARLEQVAPATAAKVGAK